MGSNPDKHWVWSSLSYNPNITWKIIQNNQDKPWDWYFLSYNNFNYVKKQEIKRNKAAQIIQNGCHNWLWKPITKDGKLGINVRIGLRALKIN